MSVTASTIAIAAGGLLLAASLVVNGLQYREYRHLLRENATLTAHVDVLTAARSADDRTHSEWSRLQEEAHAKADSRKAHLGEAVDSADTDADLLDYLRGLFTDR